MKTNYAKKGYAARRRTKNAIILSALALFMALTIGLTWTFWQGQLNDAYLEHPLNVIIGEAGDLNTIVHLDTAAFGDGSLIPQESTNILGGPTDVHYLEITIPVRWNLHDNVADRAALSGRQGTLTVEALSFMFDGTSDDHDMLNVVGREYRDPLTGLYEGTAPLFEISIWYHADSTPATVLNERTEIPDEGVLIIGGDGMNATPVYITIRIVMNIPWDVDMYNIVAGETGVLTVNFEIEFGPPTP